MHAIANTGTYIPRQTQCSAETIYAGAHHKKMSFYKVLFDHWNGRVCTGAVNFSFFLGRVQSTKTVTDYRQLEKVRIEGKKEKTFNALSLKNT